MNICLQTQNLNYQINNQQILENINFEVKKGDYIGLLGPNGGGKTTLIKIILGILEPTSGSINKFGSKIGYLPQYLNSSGLDFPATVLEIILTGLKPKLLDFEFNKKRDLAFQFLEKLDIIELKHKRLNQLSGGQRQRVLIARSLISQPDIIILDEPTAPIDAKSQAKFYDFLRTLNLENNLTIILISHDISVITKEAKKVFFLNQKLECYHNIEDFNRPENLQNLFGTSNTIINHSHHH